MTQQKTIDFVKFLTQSLKSEKMKKVFTICDGLIYQEFDKGFMLYNPDFATIKPKVAKPENEEIAITLEEASNLHDIPADFLIRLIDVGKIRIHKPDLSIIKPKETTPQTSPKK